jgi:hypothetical protein
VNVVLLPTSRHIGTDLSINPEEQADADYQKALKS